MSINLLPSEAKFQASRIHFRKKILKITYGLGGLWLGLIGVVYILWIVFRQIYLNSEARLAKSEEAYGKLSSFLVTNQKLRYKVKLVSSVLDTRFEYSKAFKTILNLFSSSVNVTNFELKKDGVFAVDGEVNGFGLMDEVEKRILEINQGKSNDFNTAVLKQLSVSGSKWKFSLDVTLK